MGGRRLWPILRGPRCSARSSPSANTEIAQHPRARRKAGELLAEAPEIVGTFAERLARVGAEPDPQVAKALDVKEREVVGARKALATILRRAENR